MGWANQPLASEQVSRVVSENCKEVHLSVAIVRAYALPVCVPARAMIKRALTSAWI